MMMMMMEEKAKVVCRKEGGREVRYLWFVRGVKSGRHDLCYCHASYCGFNRDQDGTHARRTYNRWDRVLHHPHCSIQL